MGTAILLRSHDCLKGRLRHDAFSLSSSPKSSPRNPNPNSGRTRRRTPAAVKASGGGGDRSTVVVKGPGSNLVMGQVKILKRGEKLPEIATAKSEERFDLGLGSTDRLGPDPETLEKMIEVSDLVDGMYAGSAFVSSPPPSSVPVPGFLRKKKGAAATSDLRRLLQLDSV